MHSWIAHPDHFKPGNKMYMGLGGMTGYMVPNDKGEMVPNIVLNDQEIDALVAYLHSLK
jgi:cytochrome c oxidase subunit 2